MKMPGGTAKLSVALLITMASADSLRAQELPRWWATATGTSVSAVSVLANGTARMDGTMFGGEGGISWKRWSLRGGYAQGTVAVSASPPPAPPPSGGGFLGGLIDDLLSPPAQSVSPLDIDHVEGFLQLGWSVVPGLEIGTGARARARVARDDSERLAMWTVGARFEEAIGSESLRGFAEVWHAVAGSTSASPGFELGRGGSAGIIARVGRISTRLSYAMDLARHGADSRSETVEGVSIALGLITR
jgi:hypothetical protein